MKFILLLGLVSLFADITYEGARSITGPYLATLGASGAIVGIVVGIGELIGFSLRLISGYLSDKTHKYWTITIIGYVINLFAVPLLALTSHWQSAAAFIILERFGKAIRTPARDAMLSYATKEVGRGWGFGVHEFFDQIGAMIGPAFIALILLYKGSYHMGFGLLAIPALIALAILLFTRKKYPLPQEMEVKQLELKTKGFSKTFWIYLLAVGLVSTGFVNYPLISFHFEKTSALASDWIALFYAIAMAVDGIAALFMGRLFDLKGIGVLAIVTLISSLFAPLVFLGNFSFAIVGIVLWGIGMGAQESIMRAIVGGLAPKEKRGSAYGVLNLVFGLFWFLGSAIMGTLYDYSKYYLIAFSLFFQLASVPFFLYLRKENIHR